jgi:bisphosphoglycerate-dependent phosphoglycerate mutase
MEDKIIKQIDELNHLESKLSKLVDNMLEYLKHDLPDEAKKTGKVIVNHMNSIIAHFKHLKKKAKDKILRGDLSKEISILEQIEKYIIDLNKHPNHLKKDAPIIAHLEKYLVKVERKEHKDMKRLS